MTEIDVLIQINDVLLQIKNVLWLIFIVVSIVGGTYLGHTLGARK